jgi:hypothetical protein
MSFLVPYVVEWSSATKLVEQRAPHRQDWRYANASSKQRKILVPENDVCYIWLEEWDWHRRHAVF